MVFPVLPVGYTTLLPTTSLLNASTGLATQTITGAGTDTITGSILGVAGATGPVQWTGTISSTQTTGFTASEGRVPKEYANLDSIYTVPTDPDLLADGFDESGGLAILGSTASTVDVTSTLSYNFSAPLPSGTSFALWDPGAYDDGVSGPFTFAISAADGSATISPASWTYQLIDPFTGEVLSGNYAFNATTGILTVSDISTSGDPNQPRKVLIVTPNTPVTQFSVTATTQPQDFFGLSVIVPATTSVTTDTVVGVGNTTMTIPFTAARDATAVAPYLNNLSASVAGGIDTVFAVTGTLPTSNLGKSVLEATASYSGAMGGFQGFISDATGVTTLSGGTRTNESIIAGTGGLIFTPGATLAGGGDVYAGGGNNVFDAAGSNAGNWNVRFGGGNDTVVAASGNDTVDAGTGANLEFLGAGLSTVTSEGADTIVGGVGTLDVDGLGPGALVFAGSGGLNFVGASGANTIAGSTASETLQGGSGTILSFSFGATQYTGGSGSDTIVAVNDVAGAGALTVNGGSGNSLYFGADAGGNDIFGGTGSATIFGGGAGDLLSTGGSGVNVVAAGQGAETIDASRSSGSNTFFLNSGTASATGGSGANAYQIGTGTATITGAGTANLYVFYNLGSTNRSLEITDFNPATDFLKLNGYAAGAAAAAVASETTSPGGGTLVTLPDGTQITFDGVTQVNTSSFT